MAKRVHGEIEEAYTGGFGPKARNKFLEVLEDTGNISESLRAIGTRRASLKRYLNTHPEFAKLYHAALGTGIESIHDEAIRRARDGVEQNVWYKGEVVGTDTKHSDALMLALLKAHHPAFRDKIEVSGPDGGPIELAAVKQRFEDIVTRHHAVAHAEEGDG